jgi:hypothetical protein
VIIDVDAKGEAPEADTTVDYTLRDFMHELLLLNREQYHFELTKILSEYFCASRPVIYKYRESQNELETLSAATSTKANGQTTSDSAEPTALLLRVAQSGDEYCCDDSACIQMAIEQIGVAPHEYIARIQPDAHHTYILRLRFEENLDAEELHGRVSDARQIIQIVERLSPQASERSTTGSDHDGKVSVERKAHGRRTLQEAQLALTGAMQLLNRLDKFLRD